MIDYQFNLAAMDAVRTKSRAFAHEAYCNWMRCGCGGQHLGL